LGDLVYPATMMLQGGANVFELLLTTGPLARVVLLILLVFSVASWGVILSKGLLIRRIRKESAVFWRIFRKGHTLPEISTACEVLRFSPLVPVFDAGYEMIAPVEGGGEGDHLPSEATVQRALFRASAAQLTELETRMTFLATTASVTPFIGLFGTVWGVMGSFAGLANASVGTLQAVAPGMAEALIATAFGLFAAIPALVAYNHFVAEIRSLGGQLDDLQAEFLALAERRGLR
jgi:biopolymer transport protein TolQ